MAALLGFIVVEIMLTIPLARVVVTSAVCRKATFKQGTMISSPNFEKLLSYSTFVDKTMLIADLLNNSAAREYQLMTCPTKFGKSTNLDMMKRFLEGKINTGGGHKEVHGRTYKMFTDSKRNLKIGPLLNLNNGFFVDHFQQYAVVHVSFKVSPAASYADALDKLCDNFRIGFEPFRDLQKEVSETPENVGTLECIKRVLNSEMDKERDILNGLFELVKFINPYSKIFLLIDDYDDFIIQAIEHDFDICRVHRLIDGVFSLLFSPRHRYISHAFITGTLNIFDDSKFACIKHWGFLDSHHLVPYFGFTESEVSELLESHNVPRDDANAVKRYSNEYHVAHSSLQIYNPYSIARHLCSRNLSDFRINLENCWTRIVTDSNFYRNLYRNEMGEKLIKDVLELKKFTFSLKERWSLNDLKMIQEMAHKKWNDLTKYRMDLILSYLFHHGYFSFAEESNTYCVPDSEEIRTCLKEGFKEAKSAVGKKLSKKSAKQKFAENDDEEPRYQHITRKTR